MGWNQRYLVYGNCVHDSSRPYFGIGLRILAAFGLATVLSLVKYAGEAGISLPEILFWRQVLTVPVILVWLWSRQELHRLKTQRIGSHAARAGLGFTNMMFTFGAAMLLPLAESTALGFTTPLFAVLISAFVLHQYVGPWRWMAVMLGFMGVLIIAQPGGHPVSVLGTTIGLVAGLSTAVVIFQIKDLVKTEEPICAVFWFGVFGSCLGALLLPFFATSHTPWQWFLLFSFGILGIVVQLLLTASLRFAPVSTLVIIDYSLLIWTTMYGWLIWDKLPPAATWLGVPLIIGAGLIIFWRERRQVHIRAVQ